MTPLNHHSQWFTEGHCVSFPIIILCSAGLEGLLPKRGTLSQEDTEEPRWIIRSFSCHLGPLTSLSSGPEKQEEESLHWWIMDSGYLEEAGLPLHNGGREECGWSSLDPLGSISVLPCTVVTVSGLVQWPQPKGMLTIGPDPQVVRSVSH